MTKKEIIKLAAYEYMTQYWRDNAIYNALKEYDIYPEDIHIMKKSDANE